MHAPAEPRWWRRRRDLALHAAREAHGRAAIGLVGLDATQRAAGSHLDFLTGVDNGPSGARLRAQWQPISDAADTAIAAYLESSSRWDVEEDLELEAASAAATAFDHHAEAMQAGVDRIEQWSRDSTATFIRITSTLEQLKEQRQAAERAIITVHEELQRAEANGLLAPQARALLGQAVDRFARVEQGPSRHPMSEVLLACEDTVSLANQAGESLRALPYLRRRVTNRTLALHTRRSALEGRATAGDEDLMRTLRRDYAHACSADLDDNPARVRRELDLAREQLLRAAMAAADSEQRWHDALSHLEQAARALDEAQERIEEPCKRLDLLRRVSTDPESATRQARFVVRDARHLLMSGPYAPRQAELLDGLAARLDRVEQILGRPHPDWLAYSHTLDAIVDGARGLVVDLRASRARQVGPGTMP